MTASGIKYIKDIYF